MVEMYNNGGPFMHPILGCLIFGLAMSLYKIWSLFMASINTRKFLIRIKKALAEGGVEAATKLCENTRGPVAAIFHSGLLRANRGLEHVEKAIMNAGTIEMAFLERGLLWLSTVSTVAPMLGFLGTVSGMISAFQDIAAANDISPAIVATGISEALLTTMFGLIVGIIIQTTHNFFVSKVDRLVIDMEESSVDLVDSLIDLDVDAKQA
jgi:biopolymer transport protein ExbB